LFQRDPVKKKKGGQTSPQTKKLSPKVQKGEGCGLKDRQRKRTVNEEKGGKIEKRTSNSHSQGHQKPRGKRSLAKAGGNHS